MTEQRTLAERELADLGRGAPNRLDGAQRRLVAAGWLFAIGTGLHVVDHLRRGHGSISDELHWAGTVALIVQVVVITLVVTHHRAAARAAVLACFPLAVGFFAAHWLPEWSVLSDPVWEIGSARWYSYLATTAEIVTALALGVAALAIVRQHGGPVTRERRPARGRA